MLGQLKEAVFKANMELPVRGLVTFTWGNVSGIDREQKLIIIKPSGVPYETMTADDMVVIDYDGNVVEGRYKPSTDAATHIELYRKYEAVGGVVHTHSNWATQWAQAGRPIPCYGTTHADYFYGEIPCARALTEEEINTAYEKYTGMVIIETLKDRGILDMPGILCKHHGPFSWGKTPEEAVHNAVVLEEVARMAFFTEQLNPEVKPIPAAILDKHYFRKHGANAYYGQK